MEKTKMFLKVRNDDGQIKCKKCGVASEIMFVGHAPYCQDCNAEVFGQG